MDTNHSESGEQQELDQLAKEAGELFPVPEPSADEYLARIPELAQIVDNLVLNRPDVNRIVGACPVDAVTANHRNHARFMGTVFKLGLPRMLAAVIPWAYRVYLNHGVCERYFQEELQGWKQALANNLPTETAKPLQDIYTWMLDQHERMLQLAREMRDIGPQISTPEKEEIDELVRCLLKCDSRSSREKICQNLPENDLAYLYLNRIQPVMYRVGELWAEGKIQVAQEHMVTALMSRVMTLSYDDFPVTGERKGKAVLTCATDEFHEMGARIISDLLELDGWDVTFLGANVPTDNFAATIADQAPDIVGISATIPYNLLRVQGMVNSLRERKDLTNCKIMAGGIPFCIDSTIVDKLGLDGWACNGKAAVEKARQWWKESCRQ
ncbi:MAG: cobalamin B12-binding domain-containing protein [Verrucomicrobiota bacterium]